VHNGGVVFASEDVARAPHVSSKLIYLVEAAIDDISAICGLPQIRDDKIVRFGLGKLGEPQINATHPKAAMFQVLNKM
jgi:hypothetical protein